MNQNKVTHNHGSSSAAVESSSRVLMVDAAVRAADSAPNDQAFECFVHELSSSLGVDSIFDEPTDVPSRRLIAIGFLRVLQENDLNESKTTDMRRRVVQHVSEAIGANLQTMGFELDEQTHELVAKLRSVMGHIYQQLGQAVARLDPGHASINVSKYREALLQTHNQRTVQWVQQELVDELAMGIFNDALTHAVNHEENSSDSQFIETYHTAQNELDAAIDQLGSCGDYAAKYLQEPLERVKQYLALNFEESPLSSPAHINVTLAPKEYRLSVGSQFDLRLRIHNVGNGPALDVSIVFESDELILNTAQDDAPEGPPSLELGNLQPNHTYEHIVDVTVQEETSDLLIEARWTNTDLSNASEAFVLHIPSQSKDIDWADLERRSPFNTTIAEGDTFVGRDKLLNQLIRLCTTPSMNSAYIWGQRRVGKTSLVKQLEQRLASLEDGDDYRVVYIDQFFEPTAEASVRVLGTEIMEQMKALDASLAQYPVPELKDSLSPVRTFVRNALTTSGKRFVFIIDEFDQMPRELYEARSETGNAFFQILGKGFSSITNCCFFLVGGELIPVIKDIHGARTNQFDVVTVGPFDRSEEYEAFEAMVQSGTGPVHFHDSAIDALWDACHGHPYFLNMIGSKLWDQILATRDASVTSTEVKAAIHTQVNDIDGSSFAHYWDDGIQQNLSADESQQNRADLNRRQRRQLFSATANVTLDDGDWWLLRDAISEQAQRLNLSATRSQQLIDELVERKILVARGRNNDDRVRYMVPLFYQWLRVRGFHFLQAALAREQSGDISLQDNEEDPVTLAEISQLIDPWPHFTGRRIEEGRVQGWLSNFRPNDQRLMFKLLGATKVFTEGFIRSAYKELHELHIQKTEMQHRRTGGQRNDVLVTDLGQRPSNSLNMARLYQTVNKLIRSNNINADQLEEKLQDRAINAVVFVDDFAGTGNALKTQWEDFGNQHPQTVEALRTGSVQGFMFVAVGVDKAIESIEDTLRDLDLDIHVEVHTTLTDADRAFHETSSIWNGEEREAAREIATHWGARLQSRGAALGFRNDAQLVVFEHNVPNNTLPILYKEQDDFQGLFKRDISRT